MLMRKDSPLAGKECISPEDLWDKPLIISHQRQEDQHLSQWIKRDLSKLEVVATYNLVYERLPSGGRGVGVRPLL